MNLFRFCRKSKNSTGLAQHHFSRIPKNGAGFTIIEGLIVITILSLAILGSFIVTKAKQERVVFKDAKVSTLRAFERARNNAETGVGDNNHGVRVDESLDTVTIFEEFVPDNDIKIFLPPSVNIEIFDGNDNDEVLFKRLSTQTDELTEIRLNGSLIITIMPDGTIISDSSP
jgi:type II secretory pathway pseudopilin PulG